MIILILLLIIIGVPISVYFQIDKVPSVKKFNDFLKGVFFNE